MDTRGFILHIRLKEWEEQKEALEDKGFENWSALEKAQYELLKKKIERGEKNCSKNRKRY